MSPKMDGGSAGSVGGVAWLDPVEREQEDDAKLFHIEPAIDENKSETEGDRERQINGECTGRTPRTHSKTLAAAAFVESDTAQP